jgi:transposase InsO family protein
MKGLEPSTFCMAIDTCASRRAAHVSDAWLIEQIARIHERSHKTYGPPRMHAELRLEHGVLDCATSRLMALRARGRFSVITSTPSRRSVRTPLVEITRHVCATTGFVFSAAVLKRWRAMISRWISEAPS